MPGKEKKVASDDSSKPKDTDDPAPADTPADKAAQKAADKSADETTTIKDGDSSATGANANGQ